MMKFYKFTAPNYESDAMYSRRNPITWVYQYFVPGILCPICGAWAGHRRLFLPVEDAGLTELLKEKPYPIPMDDWYQRFGNAAERDNFAQPYRFAPGDVLGKPTGIITTNQVPNFIFPWEGGVLVTQQTRDIIVEANLSGCQFLKMDLIDQRRKKGKEQPLPMIYVLLITGRINQPSEMDRCPVCARMKASYSIDLNEWCWDGNDFIIDEHFPDLIYITERAFMIFKEKRLKNFQCVPV